MANRTPVELATQSVWRHGHAQRRGAWYSTLLLIAAIPLSVVSPSLAQTGDPLAPRSTARAASPEYAERAIARICEAEKSIFSPEPHYLSERCEERIRIGTTEFWFSYQSETDSREEPCVNPKPWCAYPIRQLIVIIRDDAVPGREELLTDTGIRGFPDFGTMTYADETEQRARYSRATAGTPYADGQPAKGEQYLDWWTCRYGQAIAIALNRKPESCITTTLVKSGP